MNKNIKRPFQEAQIEIIEILGCDVITTSPSGSDPFPGEDDDFGAYYWNN